MNSIEVQFSEAETLSSKLSVAVRHDQLHFNCFMIYTHGKSGTFKISPYK